MSGEWTGRRTLVTGGVGFLGSHLVEALVEQGAQVTVVDELALGHDHNLARVRDSVELHRLDLASADLGPVLADGAFDLIFHLAANARVAPSVENPRLDFKRNALATFNLLEAMRSAAPDATLLHTSSAAVYGDGSPNAMDEDHPIAPIAPYGVSKLAAEQYVRVYARVYGMRTVNLRLFPMYGPRQRQQVVYDLMRKVRQDPEELPVFGDGTQVRDFNYVTNAVDAMLLVVARGRLEGGAYNVASDESISIAELARMISERMGASPRFVYSGEVRRGESQRWVAATSRLRALGYRPRVPLADGLTMTVEWFQREEPE